MRNKLFHFLIFLCISFSLSAQIQMGTLNYGFNAQVNALAYDNDYIYAGGLFTSTGINTGGLGKVTTSSDVAQSDFPSVPGNINCIVSDGSGGLYIGGSFSLVDGISRNRIAHINSDGSLDANWNPNADGIVKTIAVSGTDIYVGGDFTTIGGQSRNRIAKLNNTNGNADATWNPNANSTVVQIAISGSDVYAGGDFTTIGGESRNYLAKLNNTNGTADATWNPNPNGNIITIAINSNDIYVGGTITSIGGQTRSGIAKLNNTNGDADATWNPNANNRVFSIIFNASDIYVAGDFTTIGGQSRNYIAKLNNTDGNADATWNPNADNPVNAISLSGSAIYAAGQFENIGGLSRNYIAKINVSDASIDASWDPNSSTTLNAILASGSNIFIGGSSIVLNNVTRNYIARFSIITKEIDNTWNPNANGNVNTIAISGSDIYVGGQFTNIGGSSRNYTAKLNNTDGSADATWNPNANSFVNCIVINSNNIYIGGEFTNIGGFARNYIAQLNNTNGDADINWLPNADNFVNTLAVSGTDIYAGGNFNFIGGQGLKYLAKLNNTNGSADATWNPNPNNNVGAIAINGSNIYAGGDFTNIGGVSLNYVAKLNNTNGEAEATWNPNPNNTVKTFAFNGTETYVGGSFTTIDGETRFCIAKLSSSGDVDASWNANADGIVYATIINEGELYVGGNFQTLNNEFYYYFGSTILSNSWTGTTNTDWNTATNWSFSSVPISSENVSIPNVSNDPVIDASVGSPATCYDLSIESGAVLTINAGKALTVTGDIDNSGTLTLESDATGTASIITAGTVGGSGTYNVEQYVVGSGGATPNGPTYYLSSPVASAVSGVFSASGNNQLWSHSESSFSFTEITGNATSLSPMAGYAARLVATETLNFTGGALNTGNISNSSISRTGVANLKRGLNLIGNPYPSFLDWEAASAAATNLSTTIWFRAMNNSNTMVFDTYNATSNIGTNNNQDGAVTQYIAPMQAFWVQVPTDGQTGTLSFTNAMRSHQAQTILGPPTVQNPMLRLNINDGANSDQTIVLFNQNAQNSFDAYDSKKMSTGAIAQVYTNINGNDLVINGLTDIASNATVPLIVSIPANGQYSFSLAELQGFSSDQHVYIEDVQTGVTQDLQDNSTYTFTANKGTISTRFNLLFAEGVTTNITVSTGKNQFLVYQNENNIFINGTQKIEMLRVFDITGKEMQVENISMINTSSWNAGVYLVNIQSEGKTETQKIVVMK